jgi:hypothetical protein
MRKARVTSDAVQAVLMVDRMISPFTLMLGPVFFTYSLVLVKTVDRWTDYVTAVCIFILWVLVSRTVRVLPHFYRCPGSPSISQACHASRTALELSQ